MAFAIVNYDDLIDLPDQLQCNCWQCAINAASALHDYLKQFHKETHPAVPICITQLKDASNAYDHDLCIALINEFGQLAPDIFAANDRILDIYRNADTISGFGLALQESE